MTITDEQIKQILDLTTHPPQEDFADGQREGMDTLMGTDEELIERVR